MGTVSDVIAGGTEGSVQQGPVLLESLIDLSAEGRESQLYDKFEHFRQIKGETIQGYYVRFTKLINDMRNIKMTMSRMQLNSKFVNNMLPEWREQVTNIDDDVDDSPENDLALNVDHVFEADECDAFDSDVDEGPTTQTMFMTNLTIEDPITMNPGHQMTQTLCRYKIIIPFYVEDNEDHVVQRNVSSVRNDALMSILDEMHEQGVQSRLANKPDIIIKDSVTSELARYKELVGE
ncbi:hypothetical protein Tco_0412825 [Tanacetum coccineum]